VSVPVTAKSEEERSSKRSHMYESYGVPYLRSLPSFVRHPIELERD
jgi:hypothetical protein